MIEQAVKKLTGQTLRLTEHIETGLLIVILLSMIVLGVLQIGLRNFFDTGLLWIDPLLRAMVLWLALLGALVASRQNKHIAIDLLSRFLSPGHHAWLQAFTGLFTSVVCALVAFHGARFVFDEYQFNTIAFLNIPTWSLGLVIPLAFGLIGLRYLLSIAELIFCKRRMEDIP